MRRLVSVLVLIATSGCGALRDAFSAHADAAARAGGQALSVERLAALVAGSERVPLHQEALSTIAHVWVDYTTFAQRVARGESLDDSALVLAAALPTVSQMKWERFHERLVSSAIDLSARQVDSAYAAGAQRLFQHILLRVPPSAPAADEAAKRAQIEGIRRQARGGGGAVFAQLAARHSEDQATRQRGGLLGLAGLDDPLVPEFKDAAWALQPGEVSDVVRTSFGYHVIRRPPLAEVRDSFRVQLEDRLVVRFDSLYLDSLTATWRLAVRGSAPRVARQAVSRLEEARTDDRALATYRGGRFRVRDLVNWLFVLDPRYTRGFPTASDEQITRFIETFAQRQILLVQADSAGVGLTREEWAQVNAEHDSAVAVLRRVLGMSPEALADSAAADGDARVRIAAERVDDYLERLLDGRAEFAAVPPFLAAELKRGTPWSVDQAAVAEALARAQALRARSDSAAASQDGPRLTPAPGPAPTPVPPSP